MLTLPGPNGLATPEWWITFPVFGLALYWAILPAVSCSSTPPGTLRPPGASG